MASSVSSRVLDRTAICRRLKADADALIREEEARYTTAVEAVARQIARQFSHRCAVLLSGPSASGKTTTAHKLQQALHRFGRQASTISLDNFYRGRGVAPRLPDGSLDYETVEALDLPLLQACMQELIGEGRSQLPVFDFHTGCPKPQRQLLEVEENSIVIFEGIHALNPRLESCLTGDTRFKVFINVETGVSDQGVPLLSGRELRMARRLLRDYRFRNSSLENTMDMWRQVVRGEELYLFPYVSTADITFDTAHAYEPAVMSRELLPLLQKFPTTSPFSDAIEALAAVLNRFDPLSIIHLPADSLLREFVGDDHPR